MLKLDTFPMKTICFARLDSYTVNKSGPALPRVPESGTALAGPGILSVPPLWLCEEQPVRKAILSWYDTG